MAHKRSAGDEHLGKVVSQDELILQRAGWKRNGQRVVFTPGCFDLLHPGHIRLLEQARALGDILIVGIESDATACAAHPAIKGIARPIVPAAERAEILAALAAVDYVVQIDDATAAIFVSRFAPDIVVQGGASSAPAPASEKIAAGTKVVRIPLEPGHSTALLIERITQLRA